MLLICSRRFDEGSGGIIESGTERRQSFSYWLRSGRRPPADTIERKFNPYHDPRDGRFTFAPGGPRALSDVIISYGRSSATIRGADMADPRPRVAKSNAERMLDPKTAPRLIFASSSRTTRGSNIRAFHDPMTLEQAFPACAARPAELWSRSPTTFSILPARHRPSRRN